VRHSKREELIYKIMTAETTISVRDEVYILRSATPYVRLQSLRIFNEILRKRRFEDWLTDQECLYIAVSNELCSKDIDENLKKIEKEIENTKVRLFTSLFVPDVHRETKVRLAAIKEKQLEMQRNRHMFDHMTLEGFANMIKKQYLVSETLYYAESNERVWDNVDAIDMSMLERVVSEEFYQSVGIDEIRELARTDPWRNYWNINKSNPFGGSCTIELTDEQRTLILFSKMYDSAYDHQNCPPDDIINDDDLFDGWMISERRKGEKDKMSHQFDERMSKQNSKMQNADEVFLVAKTKEDAQRINGMNDTRGKIIKAQRNNVIKHKGRATDSNFQDRRLQIQQTQNQKFMSQVKGK